MTLSEAITAVEASVISLDQATQTQAAAQTKYEAALAAKQAGDKGKADAVTSFNGALDVLISAATAAKIPVTVAG